MLELLNMQVSLQLLLLIFARLGALLAVAPFWGSRLIPIQVRVFFTLLLSLVLLPLVWNQAGGQAPLQLSIYFLLLLKEIILGLIMGLVGLIIFYAIQVAGQIIDTQMGFGMVNVFDPQAGIQLPLLGNYFYLLAIVLFLITDSHHYFLEAVVRSYRLIPPAQVLLPPALWRDLAGLFGNMLAFALRIALPAAGILFIADLSLGIIARTVPQMNVFVLGIPSKIIVGMLTIMFFLPLYTFLLQLLFRQVFYNTDLLLQSLG